MTSRTRTLLRAKARLGRWDPRYLEYFGGIPHVFGDKPKLRSAVMRAFGKHGLVITATSNGVHAPGSFHRLKRAFDAGLIGSEIGTATGRRRLRNYQLAEYNAWRAGRRRGLIELIGPDNNAIVLRGVHSPLPEGSPLENQHDNHVHVAY